MTRETDHLGRRALLRTVGAANVAVTTALAGCTSFVTTASSAEIAERDDVADRHGLDLDAELVHSEYTDDHPARLRLTLTNGDELQQISWYRFEGNRRSDPHGYWLFPACCADELGGTDRWVVPEGWGDSAALGATVCRRQLFSPEETTSAEFLLVDDAGAAGYLPNGTYRWEKSYEVLTSGPVRTEPPTEPEPREFDWGFSVEFS